MNGVDRNRSDANVPTTTAEFNECECLLDLIEQQDYKEDVFKFIRDLKPAETTDDDSGNEFGVQDQQPTEATDDGIPPAQLQLSPVATAFPTSVHDENCSEQMCSTIHEIPLTDEALSTVISEIDSICPDKMIPPSPLTCRPSLCVPYTNVPDDEEALDCTKQILTTLTIDSPEPKKDKNDPGHIMISYNHSTKPICLKIARALKDLNYPVWIDEDEISGDIFISMATAIENASVILMAVNEQYYASRYCQLEAEYAMERGTPLIPMLMQSEYKPIGWLGLLKGAKLQIDFSQLAFDQAFNLLVREIEAIRIGFSAEKINRTHENELCTTTMHQPWTNFGNVHEWSAEDVTEWLYREKLDVFQQAFTRFTGATLWQLYKIKFDSAPDYHRTVEKLLPEDVPLRLFHNLSLSGALESLFPPSIHNKR